MRALSESWLLLGLVTLALGCAGANARRDLSGSLSLELQLPHKDGRSLNDNADLVLRFRNDTRASVCIPAGGLILERNVFVLLFRNADKDPFDAGPCEALLRTTPPFQNSPPRTIVLQPGEAYERRIQGLMRWVYFVHEDDDPFPENARGRWFIRACFSGAYPFDTKDAVAEAGVPLWSGEVRSARRQIQFE